MTFQNYFLAVCVLLMLLDFAQSQQRHNVSCGHQQEECVCRSNAKECYFELEVEELQTFTSYMLDQNDGSVVTRGIPGDIYFWQGNTLTQSINCPSVGPNFPECGPCSQKSFQSFYSYTSQLETCSLPMTVDGSTYRLFIAVNGRIPGPTLVVEEDQVVIVKVTNKLTSEGITVHWHGMHQRKTPWMDGVAFVSQAPIVPGAEFTYIFKANPPGTHWYHSHAGAQRTDGLFGALIVRENETTRANVKTELQKVDIPLPPSEQEHTLTFLDWQRESSLNLFVQLHSTLGFYPGNSIGQVPVRGNTLYTRTRSSDGIEVGPNPFWSGLINGRGRHRTGPTSFAFTKLSIFNVNTSSVYRFRLIGAQSLFAFRFSIDGHKLTVIASDGHFIKPIEDVDYVIVHTGERYDVLVTANQPVNNYWIRAETLEPPQTNGVQNSAEAILHYERASDIQSITSYSSIPNRRWSCTANSRCRVVNCPFGEAPNMMCIPFNIMEALIPSNSIRETIDSQPAVFFNFGFEGSSTTSAINGRNFKLPVTPYQTYSEAYEEDKTDSVRGCDQRKCDNNSRNDLCECTYVKEIGGSTFPSSSSDPPVVFVLSAVGFGNRRDFSHPIHLHGHSFSILDVQYGTYNSAGTLDDINQNVVCNNELCRSPKWNTNYLPLIYRNARTSIRKDTVIVPAGGYVVIAFEADNPGYWFMHCHIESHQLEGMGVIIREYPERYHADPPADINKVGNFKLDQLIVDTIASADSLHLKHIGIIVIGVVISLLYSS